MISSSADAADVRRAFAAGARGYIPKPDIQGNFTNNGTVSGSGGALSKNGIEIPVRTRKRGIG